MTAAYEMHRADLAETEEWMLANVLADARSIDDFFNDLAADLEAAAATDNDTARSIAKRSAAQLRVFGRLFEGIARAYLHEPEGIVVRKLRAAGPQSAYQLLKACQAEATGHRDLTTIRPAMQFLMDMGIVQRMGDLWRLRRDTAKTRR